MLLPPAPPPEWVSALTVCIMVGEEVMLQLPSQSMSFVRQKVFKDKKGELGIKRQDSNQMKDIRVLGS
jgi:hypothetical protein